MSQENVEIVRRAFQAAFRKPKPDVDTLNALYHSDHEFVSLIQRIEGGWPGERRATAIGSPKTMPLGSRGISSSMRSEASTATEC